MMPVETSYMPLFKRVGTLYGKIGGMPLYQEFHYGSIVT
jgi:hypothetical protein